MKKKDRYPILLRVIFYLSLVIVPFMLYEPGIVNAPREVKLPLILVYWIIAALLLIVTKNFSLWAARKEKKIVEVAFILVSVIAVAFAIVFGMVLIISILLLILMSFGVF